MSIIAFIGFQRVGKSTAAGYLESKGFVRHNFKDALVAEIKQNFPDLLREIGDVMQEYIPKADRVDVTNLLFQIKPPLMRALLQNYGTEVRRGDDPHYWTTKWMQNAVLHFQEAKRNLVVDDIRFINEANTVREFGKLLNIPYEHKIIRLTRPDITTGGTHASETEHLSIQEDYTIKCQPGDHEHLYAELDRILDEMRQDPEAIDVKQEYIKPK